MAGRNKNPQKAAPVNPGQKTVTLQPRKPHETRQIESEFNGHKSGYPGRSSMLGDSSGLDGEDAAVRYATGEVADIPGFLRGRSAREDEMH